jgi:hypothetical protein
MANSNAAFGLRPTGYRGVQPSYETVVMQCAYNASAIYKGDPVISVAAGFIAVGAAGTAVSQWAGVFWGCRYLSTSQGKVVYNHYWPGSDVASNQIVECFIIPWQTNSYWLIQSDATGIARANIWENRDIATYAAGSALTGVSAVSLAASGATTATLPMRIVDIYGTGGMGNIGPGSEAGAYNWVVVAANKEQQAGLTT